MGGHCRFPSPIITLFSLSQIQKQVDTRNCIFCKSCGGTFLFN